MARTWDPMIKSQRYPIVGHHHGAERGWYAKETMMRALAATRKRHAHLLAQKELDLQNADGVAASPQDDKQQTSSMTKTSVRSQR